MNFLTIFFTIYAISTTLAIIMTYQEQKRKQQKSPLFTLIGYVLCSVWPAVIAFILIFDNRRLPSPSR